MSWKRATQYIVVFIILSGCGGGGSSATDSPGEPPSPPNPPSEQITNVIEGNWFTIYPSNQCVETYRFSADGTFEVLSNDAMLSGTYSFVNLVESGNRHGLELVFSAQNAGLDCEGTSGDVVGVTLPLFVEFDSTSQLGLFETNSSSEILLSLTLENPIALEGFQETVPYGELVSFKVNGERDFALTPELVLAPAGMKIDAQGNVTWTPEMPMFESETKVNVHIKSTESYSDIVQTIKVQSPQRLFPTVRTRSYVTGGGNFGSMRDLLVSGNFDQDPGQEVIFLDGGLTMVSEGEEELNWEWTYPFDFPAARGSTTVTPAIRTFDTNDDGIDNIYMSYGRTIFTIDNLNDKARVIYESDHNFTTFDVADFNNDGQPEITVLQSAFEGDFVEVWDTATQSVMMTLESVDSESALHIGNVDQDASLEIVLSEGIVFDVNSQTVQWNFADGFGQRMILADLEQSGIKGVIGYDEQNVVHHWNVDEKAQVASSELPVNSVCTILAGNVNQDDDVELLVYDCNADRLNIYSQIDDILAFESDVSFSSYSTNGLHIVDANQDGRHEVMWNSVGTFQPVINGLSFAELEQGAIQDVKNYKAVSHFYAAGWAQVAPDKMRAIALAGQPRNSDFGIVQMDTNGKFEFGQVIPDVDRSPVTAVTDLRLDGYWDVILPISNISTPQQMSIREVNSDTLLTNIELDSDFTDTFKRIRFIDVTGDEVDDALLMNEETFFMIDLSNNQVILSEPMNRGSVTTRDHDFAVRKTGDGAIQIALGAGAGLKVFNFKDGGLTLLAEHNANCVNLEYTAMTGSLFCHEAVGLRNFFTVFDDTFREVSSVQVPGFDQFRGYTDFVSIPGSDNFYASALISNEQNGRKAHIVEVNPFLLEHVWQSPEVIGRVPKGNLHLLETSLSRNTALTFSTVNAFYLTH